MLADLEGLGVQGFGLRGKLLLVSEAACGLGFFFGGKRVLLPLMISFLKVSREELKKHSPSMNVCNKHVFALMIHKPAHESGGHSHVHKQTYFEF